MLDIPKANIQEKNRTISAVWVIPLIAALIGAWLVFKSATEEVATVEVSFKSASGLEVGKSSVKLLDINVGTVRDIQFSNDLTSVVVTLELKGIDKKSITNKTRFWVVRPRVGADGVSGLETLLSGAYIEIDPGDGGEIANQFKGLEAPDIRQRSNLGTRYILRSKALGSLATGSPIKYRGIQVGEVTKYKLVDDHQHVDIEVFVAAPHDQYIKQQTRFWNISGVGLKLNSEGFQLDMDSMTSLMIGGIAFSTEGPGIESEPAAAKTVFNLHKTQIADIEETLTLSVPMKLYFANGVKGLSKGATVEFKGLRMGTVTDVGVEFDKSEKSLLTFAMINIEPQRLPTELNEQQTDSQRIARIHRFFKRMVSQGMRGQLTSGNILTGQSQITLDFFPMMKKGQVKFIEGVMVLPTAQESLEGLLDKVDQIMQRFEAMPIEEIGRNIAQTTASVNSLVHSLNAVEGGVVGVQIEEAISELTRAARSMRSMTEYLERHPEALLKGKGQP
ncbi:MAG: MlaD family protein [Cycloclasticus sp.]